MWQVLQNNPGRVYSYDDFVALAPEKCRIQSEPIVEELPLTVPAIPPVPIVSVPTVPTGICASRPTLRKIAAGFSVSELPTLLNSVGGASLRVDGDFGPLTNSAVLAFQVSKGLAADGIVGPDTQASICGSSSRVPSNIFECKSCLDTWVSSQYVR